MPDENPPYHLLNEDERRAIRAPIENAAAFPRQAYLSQDFFELEVERVFSANWTAIGMAPCLREPGSAYPVWIFGIPLVMVRDEKGKVRVFHNISVHDGCPVVLAPQKGLSRLEAPYHGWVYDLQGRLVAAPFWDGREEADLEGLRARGVDLEEVRSAQWLDIVFVNLSGGAPTLEEFLAPMISFFDDYDFSSLSMAFDSEDGDGLHRFPAEANWKILWENYAPDVYHENFVHTQYRKSPYVPRVDQEGRKTFEEINDRGFMGLAFETAAVPSTYPGDSLPLIRRKSDGHAITRSAIMNFYPNLGILVFPSRVRISLLLPQEAGRCEWQLASLYNDGAATDPTFKQDRENSIAGSALARVEDDRICEWVQRGLRSPLRSKAFYSPFWEQMLYSFNNLILDDLEKSI